MRAYELSEDYDLIAGRVRQRKTDTPHVPVISLRHINKLKRLKSARGQRQRLWGLMYAVDDAAQNELDRREAALQGREQELRMRELQTKIDRAIDNAEIDQKCRNRLHQMAMGQLKRQHNNK